MATIKISQQNLYHNLNQLALKTGGDKTKIAAVLKDNAYGHGIELIAKLVNSFGITQAVVMNNREALQIKEYFQNILILNDTPTKVENFSYSVAELQLLNSVDKSTNIELKVDTGMHRNGIELGQLNSAFEIIKRRGLKLKGVMTHFKSADELSSELAWQKANFAKVKKAVVNAGFQNVRFHSHNSAALLRAKSFNEDIARVGIAMYGYNELPSNFEKIALKPILSLWANRTSSRTLKRGQRVGYGGDFTAPNECTVSTYNVGYGDGLFRGNSKNPLITAENLPILGRASMDFISLSSAKEEVCIFNNAQKVAKHFNTISYEITTALKEDTTRVIV